MLTAPRRWTTDPTLLSSLTSPTPPTVTARWSSRADEAAAALLRLDTFQLHGVEITAQTARSLRLRPPRFQRLATMSADGHSFPADPAGFWDEVLRQARELYGGRPGVRMDMGRL